MTHKLPPLPETSWKLHMPAQYYESAFTSSEDGYTEEQMQAYASEAVNAVLADIEARMVASDRRINDMKNTGELRQREDHAALVAQVQEQQ